MAKRKTKKYHKKRNTYKRGKSYKKRRKKTNRKKLSGGAAAAAAKAVNAANAVKSYFGKTPKINYNDDQLSFFKDNFL